MPESFFSTGNQIATTEIDVDSPASDVLFAKIKARDVELSDKVGAPTLPVSGSSGEISFEGSVVISANASLSGTHYYENFTLNAGVILTADHLVIFATGTITIGGIVNGVGGGSPANTDNATILSVDPASNGNGGAGGGGGSDSPGGNGARGGGSYISATRVGAGGAPGSGSSSAGSAGETPASWARGTIARGLEFAPLGGAGGGRSSDGAAPGGAGGAAVVLIAPTIVLQGGHLFDLRGADGASGDAGGGGGGGGVLLIRARTLTGTLALNVSGGAGGNSTLSDAGGDGADGWHQIDKF